MFNRNHDSVKQVKEQATTLAQAIIEQAANRAIYGAEKARGAASGARVRVPRMQKRAVEEVAPSIREIALQAASAALDLWQTARERAGEAVETAEHTAADAVGRASRNARSAASHVVDDATDRAKHAASHVVERAEDATDRAKHAASHVVEDATERARHAATQVVERAEDATGRAKSAASQAVDRAEEATDRAREATKNAAGASVKTSRDTGAALFWTAAAAGIVFYALLDKNRRDQVLKVLDAAVTQVRDVIRDIQGYDEEFV